AANRKRHLTRTPAMRVRHRTPSIFSISMVDVLCCALGCMILMWLVSAQKASEGEDNGKLLLTARDDFQKLKAEEARLLVELAMRRDSERKLRATLESLGADQMSALKTITELEKKYLSLTEKKAALDKLLARRQKELDDLEKRLGAVLKENTALAESVRGKSAESADARKQADDLARRLREAEESIRK